MASITIPRTKHPIAYYRKKWHRHKLKRTAIPEDAVVLDLSGVKFPLDFSLGKNIKKMYCGGYEFEIVDAMKRNLSFGDTLIDIGANVGYLSAVGASLVGTAGCVHSFEPVCVYYEYLHKMAQANPHYNIIANNFALGENNRDATITVSGDDRSIGSNSMVPGFLAGGKEPGEPQIVPVRRLDEYIEINKLSNVSLIKIDVEGFELPVLKGAYSFFEANRSALPVIIVEITNWGYDLIDGSLGELKEYMESFGYKAYCLFGNHRFDISELQSRKEKLSTDILFKP